MGIAVPSRSPEVRGWEFRSVLAVPRMGNGNSGPFPGCQGWGLGIPVRSRGARVGIPLPAGFYNELSHLMRKRCPGGKAAPAALGNAASPP